MAFDKVVLRNEVRNDPLGQGYSGMTDRQVADDMNSVYRDVSVDSIESQDVVAALVPSEFTSLNAGKQRNLWGVIGAGAIRPDDAEVKAFFAGLFPVGTATRANLLALAKQIVSRAEELGLPTIRTGWVEWVRL